jgi:predicted membrane channel-forming protein YqfA (hemolysin III family)
VESDRWVALLQALLAGWVVYVAATGMITEAALVIRTRRRGQRAILADGVVASAAAVAYVVSLPRLVELATHRNPFAWPWPTAFHFAVVILALWSGLRWRQLSGVGSRRATAVTIDPQRSA